MCRLIVIYRRFTLFPCCSFKFHCSHADKNSKWNKESWNEANKYSFLKKKTNGKNALFTFGTVTGYYIKDTISYNGMICAHLGFRLAPALEHWYINSSNGQPYFCKCVLYSRMIFYGHESSGISWSRNFSYLSDLGRFFRSPLTRVIIKVIQPWKTPTSILYSEQMAIFWPNGTDTSLFWL